ncbi:MAG: 50S ribosomal protein L4 [Syntrophales bacterium]|nr:50S ribosomal protein L4 [Syntrophales bacterium]
MPVAPVYNINHEKVKDIELSDQIFGAEINEAVIYEVVKMQQACKRKGTASTKERGEVSGGGRKPWRQKGTGRARVGTIRSPLWRHGGTVFGPKPRDYSYRVPKKVRRLALISALSMKFKEDRMIILDDFPLDEIKTRKFREVIDRFGLDKALIVVDGDRPVLDKSSRNLRNVKMLRAEGLNVYDLLKFDHVVFLEPAVKIVEGVLQK